MALDATDGYVHHGRGVKTARWTARSYRDGQFAKDKSPARSGAQVQREDLELIRIEYVTA